MKSLYSFLLLVSIHFSAVSQITDTCDYVSQNNYIGGLDCFMGSLAPFTADSYQWLNCDNNYAPFFGETNSYYSGQGSTTVALEISYLGCVDTSYCQYVCTWGLKEIHSPEIKRTNVLDPMGRETEDRPNTLLIYLYSDGSTEKVFKIEE